MKKIFMWLDYAHRFSGTVQTTGDTDFKFARTSAQGSVSVKISSNVQNKLANAQTSFLDTNMAVIERGDSTTGIGFVLEVVLVQTGVKKPQKVKLTITTTSFESGNFEIVKDTSPVLKKEKKVTAKVSVGCP